MALRPERCRRHTAAGTCCQSKPVSVIPLLHQRRAVSQPESVFNIVTHHCQRLRSATTLALLFTGKVYLAKPPASTAPVKILHCLANADQIQAGLNAVPEEKLQQLAGSHCRGEGSALRHVPDGHAYTGKVRLSGFHLTLSGSTQRGDWPY